MKKYKPFKNYSLNIFYPVLKTHDHFISINKNLNKCFCKRKLQNTIVFDTHFHMG